MPGTRYISTFQTRITVLKYFFFPQGNIAGDGKRAREIAHCDFLYIQVVSINKETGYSNVLTYRWQQQCQWHCHHHIHTHPQYSHCQYCDHTRKFKSFKLLILAMLYLQVQSAHLATQTSLKGNPRFHQQI